MLENEFVTLIHYKCCGTKRILFFIEVKHFDKKFIEMQHSAAKFL